MGMSGGIEENEGGVRGLRPISWAWLVRLKDVSNPIFLSNATKPHLLLDQLQGESMCPFLLPFIINVDAAHYFFQFYEYLKVNLSGTSVIIQQLRH